jgi:aspartyl-tRNA(Asn)/glutamyl-tRNA(Gln) amidotransferase subunit B
MPVAETELSDLLTKYELVIGLEVHCQLQTDSKLFAADANAFGAAPNTQTGVVSLAHPGALPRLNRQAVELAVRMGLACGSAITRRNVFARKNYFYPDLPKGYQLSQDKGPICVGGGIRVNARDLAGELRERVIPIHHIHLEEDAGKSIHDAAPDATCLDYNRAGTPLIELVTDPDLRSADEAGQFLTEIRRLVRCLGICDGNMEEGSLRCDVNVSVRRVGETKLGTKVEVKNLNSVRNVTRAVEAEHRRQVELIEAGGRIVQETRQFDAATGRSAGMREKETMNDYRYFPDPDLVPLLISDNWLARIRADTPELPRARFERFLTQYGLPEYDAALLTDSRELADFYETVCTHTANHKAASNWTMGLVKANLTDKTLTAKLFPVPAHQLGALIDLIDDGTVSQTAAQTLFGLLMTTPEAGLIQLAQANGLIQNRNTDSLGALIEGVLAQWPDKVAQYRKGKKNLLGLFVGEVMKQSKGAADPKMVNKLIGERLAEAQ